MTRKPRIGVFHPGTQHSWQTALAFQEAGTLGWYATSIFYDPARWPYRIERMLPGGLRQRVNAEFRRRYTAALDPAKIRHLDPVEWLETLASRLDLPRVSGWLNMAGNRSFGHAVARLCEREPVDLLWGYDTAALDLFEWAKPRGIRCVLDRTIAHPRHTNRMMAAAYQRHPEFFAGPYVDQPAALIALQDRELALADQVVVGSAMCARTLVEAGCPAEKNPGRALRLRREPVPVGTAQAATAGWTSAALSVRRPDRCPQGRARSAEGVRRHRAAPRQPRSDRSARGSERGPRPLCGARDLSSAGRAGRGRGLLCRGRLFRVPELVRRRCHRVGRSDRCRSRDPSDLLGWRRGRARSLRHGHRRWRSIAAGARRTARQSGDG